MGNPAYMLFADGQYLGDVDVEQREDLRYLDHLRGIEMFPIVSAEEWRAAYPDSDDMRGGSCPSSGR